MSENYLFTSESVTEGHPDKMADQISDAILDYVIARDPCAKVACETLVANGLCVIAGELHTTTYAPMQEIVREVIRRIGYTDATYGFDYRTAGVLNAIGEQSTRGDGEHLANGLEKGSQGAVFGYACKETSVLMPLPIVLAHALTTELAKKRKSGVLPFLRPDGKAQVTLCYENGLPVGVDAITVLAQHSLEVGQELLQEAIIEEVIKPVLQRFSLKKMGQFYINPAGAFVVGGPQGRAGLTGRKIVVDTYGGSAPHGGGAFSGKDPTKVDRSGAYMARYIAKNLVAAGACQKVLVQLSCAVGLGEPMAVSLWMYGTQTAPKQRVEACVKTLFPLTLGGIIEHLNLLQPVYEKTATYGHFGRELEEFGWEKCDKTEEIREFLVLT